MLNNAIFIGRSNVVHNYYYDYSLVDYKKSKEKIQIICPEHGIFEQTPNKHLSGQKCPFCSGKKLNDEYFIKKSNIVHSNKYDYSLVRYVNNNKKVKIICPEHGIFEQTPSNHMNLKQGCKKCSKKMISNGEFIKKSNIIHNNKYDYSLTNFTNYRKKIQIICKEHGIFIQTPYAHLNKKQGCPFCNQSKGEIEIFNFLKKLNIKYIYQKKFKNCKNKKLLPFDFYLPEHNCCIEFDGEQHYRPLNFFGGNKRFEEQKLKDNLKNKYCKDNNIKMIRIKYNENIIDKLNFLQKEIYK